MTFIASTYRAFATFDRAIRRLLGVDMRLLYGMAVPVVGMGLLIALLFGFAASTWSVVALMTVEVIMLAVVLFGFSGLLSDDADDPESES